MRALPTTYYTRLYSSLKSSHPKSCLSAPCLYSGRPCPPYPLLPKENGLHTVSNRRWTLSTVLVLSKYLMDAAYAWVTRPHTD